MLFVANIFKYQIYQIFVVIKLKNWQIKREDIIKTTLR